MAHSEAHIIDWLDHNDATDYSHSLRVKLRRDEWKSSAVTQRSRSAMRKESQHQEVLTVFKFQSTFSAAVTSEITHFNSDWNSSDVATSRKRAIKSAKLQSLTIHRLCNRATHDRSKVLWSRMKSCREERCQINNICNAGVFACSGQSNKSPTLLWISTSSKYPLVPGHQDVSQKTNPPELRGKSFNCFLKLLYRFMRWSPQNRQSQTRDYL